MYPEHKYKKEVSRKQITQMTLPNIFLLRGGTEHSGSVCTDENEHGVTEVKTGGCMIRKVKCNNGR